jgi:hypothetical protein
MISCVQPTNASNLPVKCYTRMDYGVLFTACTDGYYAQTYRQGRHKVTTWYNKNIPFYKVTCKAVNTRDLRPVPRCKGPEMGLFKQ